MLASLTLTLSLLTPIQDVTSEPVRSPLFERRMDKRLKDRFHRREGGSAKETRALRAALEWLAACQKEDGSWPDLIEEEGLQRDMRYSVGITAVALLAFLGDGHTTTEGAHSEVVERGLAWLLDQQDDSSGLIGEQIGHGFLYDHALATLVLAEAYGMGAADSLEGPLERACELLLSARNKNAAWRYDLPPKGDNDTCISGWCGMALSVAHEVGVEVDPAAFEGLESWLGKVTDQETGRVGYDLVGSYSSRVSGVNVDFPVQLGESMTALTMGTRAFTMRRRTDPALWDRQVELLLKRLPTWALEEKGIDMYYWYWGTQAMFQVGGKPWKAWNRAFLDVALKAQVDEGPQEGSWPPVGPWGHYMGTVYSTSMMALCLEVYTRYPRLLDE